MIVALTDGAVVALTVCIGGLAATVSPLLLAHVTNKANRASKESDWQRQDQVADRLEAASRRQQETQAAIVQGQRVVAQKLDVVEEQNRVIHELVNSAYTASLSAQLGALEGQLVLSRELAAMKGGDTTTDDDQKLKTTETKVHALRSLIAERERQQQIIETQLADEHARRVDTKPNPGRRRGDLPPPAAAPAPAGTVDVALPQTVTAEITLKPQESG